MTHHIAIQPDLAKLKQLSDSLQKMESVIDFAALAATTFDERCGS